MANLVLTNLDTGQEVVITDTLTLEQAIASVKSVCNSYTDNSSSNVLITAKTYADNAMLTAISNILPTIQLVNYLQNSGAVRLIVGKNADDSLKFFDIRDEKYIQAGDLLALQDSKTFTLAEIAKAKLDMTAYTNNACENTRINGRNFTQAEIARVEGLIQELEMRGFTFETFLEYLDIASDYFYPKHLNSTIGVDGNVQRLHFTNTVDAEVEIHNTMPITDRVPTSTILSLIDEKHNGFIFKYIGNIDATKNNIGLYLIKDSVVSTTPVLMIESDATEITLTGKAYIVKENGSKELIATLPDFSGFVTKNELDAAIFGLNIPSGILATQDWVYSNTISSQELNATLLDFVSNISLINTLNNYASKNWSEQTLSNKLAEENYVRYQALDAILPNLATISWVNDNFVSSSSDYISKNWVEANYTTSSMLEATYAKQDWISTNYTPLSLLNNYLTITQLPNFINQIINDYFTGTSSFNPIFADYQPISFDQVIQDYAIITENFARKLVAIPIGTITLFARHTTAGVRLPDGYLQCNGGTINSSAYPDLYDVLGRRTLPNITAPTGTTYIIKALHLF